MRPVAEGIARFAVRTPTLPPATHTNTYVVGEGRLTVFDPASPYDDERARFADALRERVDHGETLERIVLTHHHHDHVSGAVDLSARFGGVPIVAHEINAPLVPMQLDGHWAGDEELDCGGRVLRAMHTPGHAPGHLVFRDTDSGAIIAGDMVAGVGTILIDPAEGDLGDYLDSLQRMRDVNPSVLLPSHGPEMAAADQVLAFYIAHRHGRTEQIRETLDDLGAATPLELVPAVYRDQVPEAFYPVAAVQITAHLLWLQKHGKAISEGERWRLSG